MPGRTQQTRGSLRGKVVKQESEVRCRLILLSNFAEDNLEKHAVTYPGG